MNIKKQIKLDLISIKPYITFKNFALMTFIAILYMYIMGSPVITISIAMLFGIIFSSYPFLLGENAGIDGLYRIYGISSKEVVIARYINACIIFVLVSIFGFFYYLILALIKNLPIGFDILEMIAINFVIFIIMVSFQYPLYFKYGYTKAKTYALLPIFIIGGLGMVLGLFKENLKGVYQFIFSHKEVMMVVFGIFVLFIILISINLAINFYKKRDF